MKITLSPEETRWLEAEVAAGRLASVGEGVRLAMAALMFGDLPDDDTAWAEPLIGEALAQADRGEGVSADQVRAELDDYLKGIGGR